MSSYTGKPAGGALEKGRKCEGACRRYAAKRPRTGSRYQAGQVRCQTCDVWLDRRGARSRDGSPASLAKTAWFCSCCGHQLRRVPRNSIYKPRKEGHQSSDLSYFNKHRGLMLAGLGRAMAQTDDPARMDKLLPARMRVADIEYEFGSPIEQILETARSEEPNKMSLAAEFEEARSRLGRVPTREEVGPRFGAEQYEKEFGSWEHMLERLGYDPWYRKDGPVKPAARPRPVKRARASGDRRTRVLAGLRGEPQMAALFEKLDSQLATMDSAAVGRLGREALAAGAREQVLS